MIEFKVVTVVFRFKQDCIFQIHLNKSFKKFPIFISLHKILLKSKTFNESKENGTCLNQKTTVILKTIFQRYLQFQRIGTYLCW